MDMFCSSGTENITDDVIRTLKEGYRRKCGGYIIILESSAAVAELLHYGDDYRVINTHARFFEILLKS